MTDQSSYAKLEKDFIHELREHLNHSENIADVANCFAHIVGSFLRKAFNNQEDILDEDIMFTPKEDKKFRYSSRIRKVKKITKEISNSDIERIISGFAEAAEHRYKHLDKHPEKSKLKIRAQKRIK